jgi:hypothetical protein
MIAKLPELLRRKLGRVTSASRATTRVASPTFFP